MNLLPVLVFLGPLLALVSVAFDGRELGRRVAAWLLAATAALCAVPVLPGHLEALAAPVRTVGLVTYDHERGVFLSVVLSLAALGLALPHVAETRRARLGLGLAGVAAAVTFLSGHATTFSLGIALSIVAAGVAAEDEGPHVRFVRPTLALSLLAALVALVASSLESGPHLEGLDPVAFGRSVHHALVTRASFVVIAASLLGMWPFRLGTTERLAASPASAIVAAATLPSAMLALHAALPHDHGHAQRVDVLLYVALAVAAHAALAALGSRSLPRVVASVVVSQNALAIAGVLTGTVEGGVAGVLASLSVAVSGAGLALAAHAAVRRKPDLDCGSPEGLAVHHPRLGMAFFVLALLAIGVPFGAAFFAEDLLLQAFLETHPTAAYLVLAIAAVVGVSLLRATMYTFYGPPRSPRRTGQDLRGLELTGLLALAVLGVVLATWAPHLGSLATGGAPRAVHEAQAPSPHAP